MSPDAPLHTGPATNCDSRHYFLFYFFFKLHSWYYEMWCMPKYSAHTASHKLWPSAMILFFDDIMGSFMLQVKDRSYMKADYFGASFSGFFTHTCHYFSVSLQTLHFVAPIYTRPSILCVTHQMSRKKRNYSVGWKVPYEMMNYKWYLMVLDQCMTILAGTWSV